MNPIAERDKLNSLLDELLRGIQDVLESGEVLSDEFQGVLAEELRYLTGRIDQLTAEINEIESVQPPQESTPPQGADLLWILSGGDQNAFVNYLRTFPGESLRELAANPNRLAKIIYQFQINNPINPDKGIAPDGIPNAQYQSSNVAGMKYNPKTQKLLVKFQGEGKQPVYEYDGVPSQIFNLLQHGNAFAQTRGRNQWGSWWPMKNPSIGAAVNQYLKSGGYTYRRLI